MEKAKEKLEQMHRFGIRFFIDLTVENELIPYQNLLPPDTGYIRFPIRDVNIPTSIAFARKIVNCISDEVQRKKGDVYAIWDC